MSSSTDGPAAESISAGQPSQPASLGLLSHHLASRGSHVPADVAAERMGLTVGQVLRLVRFGALNGYRYGAETYVEPAIVSGQLLERLGMQEVH